MCYDAPTTPRTRRCDEAGHTFPRCASDATFSVVTADVTVSSVGTGAGPLFSIWRRS